MIHIVLGSVGGFCREDPPTSYVIGAYTDEELAKKVKMVSGYGSSIHSIEIDKLTPGILEAFKVFGVKHEQERV